MAIFNFNSDIFCERVNYLLGDTGQMELAEKIGISQGVISAIKNKKVKAPGADTIYKIAEHFNVSADWLLGLSDVPSQDTDLKAVCEYTGLSQDSVEFLNGTWNKALKNAINLLLASPYNVPFFAEISGVLLRTNELTQLEKQRDELQDIFVKITTEMDEKNDSIKIEKVGDDHLIVYCQDVSNLFEKYSQEEKEAYNKYCELGEQLTSVNERRDLGLFRLSKLLQNIFDLVEKEQNENS